MVPIQTLGDLRQRSSGVRTVKQEVRDNLVRKIREGDTLFPGLVGYGVCMHFASVDWLMSLQPAFHSSIFGPYVVSGQVLSAHAFVLVVLPDFAAFREPRPTAAQGLRVPAPTPVLAPATLDLARELAFQRLRVAGLEVEPEAPIVEEDTGRRLGDMSSEALGVRLDEGDAATF